ncbi:MAG: MmgE/PrpD family protein [Chloroflexota bacterium]
MIGSQPKSNMKTLDGLSRRLAEFSVGLELKNVPAKAQENAKIAILDCLGVAVLATSQEIGEKLIGFATSNAAPGPCTIWGTPLSLNMRDAALLNGALAHGMDYDDRNHASTYSLAVALATAEHVDASGIATLEAFIASREIRATLDAIFAKRSTGIGPGAKGWHSNGILGPIASACAASKLLRMDVQGTGTAIGLAAGSCGALTRDGGTMAKPFRVGHAAATGITCALLAREGLTADDVALEGRYGLLDALGPLPEEVLTSLGGDLGYKFDLERDVRVKPFASCTATHAGVEAMFRLVEKYSVSAAEVDHIEADLKPYPLVRQMPKRGFEGRFSMPFCLAHVLVHRRLQPTDFTDQRLEEPLIQAVIRSVEHTPESPDVTVVMKSGDRLTEAIQPPGDLKGWEQTKQKFTASAAKRLTREQIETVIDSVKQLPAMVSIRPFTAVLRTARSVS